MNKRKRKNKNKKFALFLLMFLCIILVLSFMFFNKKNLDVSTNDTSISTDSDEKGEKLDNIKKEDIHINMSVIGDIMCHNTQYKDAYNTNTDLYDFSYVFEDIKDYISSADIAVGNLETTFAGKEKGYSNYPRFNTPEQLAYDLKDFGIDVLSTANNHSLDTNYAGIVSTLDFLDSAGISHVGTSRSPEEQNTILIKDVNGIKIAFLSFTYGTNGISIPSSKDYCINLIDKDLILKQLALAKELSPDLICVNMHWGIEYQTKQNSSQEELADFLFKNDVDVILGSHPHVLQPMEKRTVTLDDGSSKECFVIFSLGNFMSGQTATNTRNSVILNLSFTKNGDSGKTSIDSVSYVPIYMYKSSNGSKQRYKVLDIEKSISDYEAGSNTSIGGSTYSTLKSELNKIKSIMGTY